ncbi:MAG TPA: hypothetical protein VNP95_06265, partial [Thermomicrobiales bacterium]|nr:hypothetical protein [Thermomicrobiales bacterium]
ATITAPAGYPVRVQTDGEGYRLLAFSDASCGTLAAIYRVETGYIGVAEDLAEHYGNPFSLALARTGSTEAIAGTCRTVTVAYPPAFSVTCGEYLSDRQLEIHYTIDAESAAAAWELDPMPLDAPRLAPGFSPAFVGASAGSPLTGTFVYTAETSVTAPVGWTFWFEWNGAASWIDLTCPPTGIPSPTATSAPTETMPPTASATATTPTSIPPTEVSTATATAAPVETGVVIVRVETADGGDLPDGIQACLDTDCRPIGVIASLDHAMLRLPSGSGVVFTDVLTGDHRVQVRAADGTILAEQSVAVGAGGEVALTLVIGSQAAPTATATATVAPGETVVPSTVTPTLADRGTVIPTSTPAATIAPVSNLPNTGGGPGDRSGAAIWLMVAAGIMLAAGVGLRSGKRARRR